MVVDPYNACTEPKNKADLKGKIAVLQRGDCMFIDKVSIVYLKVITLRTNGRLWDPRWQQTFQVNFHCLCSSEHAHITENNGFYPVSLLPPSVLKVH